MRENHLPVVRPDEHNTSTRRHRLEFGSTAGCLMLTDSLRRRGDLNVAVPTDCSPARSSSTLC
jgi:hypothetical protein